MTDSAKQSKARAKLDCFVASLLAMTRIIHPFDLTGELNVSRYPPRARRHQEAPGLSRRRRRLALSARRPLHRTARAFQSAAAEGQRGAAEARHGQDQSL